jgi:very-short-patch-repair endonuclease
MTPQEVKVWNWVRQRVQPLGYHFRRQARIAGYIVDFACLRPKVVIEIDGDSHAVGRGAADDLARDENLKKEGFTVVRIWNSEVDRTGDAVVARILASLNAGTPSP